MKKEEFIEILGDIDENEIKGAKETMKKSNNIKWQKYAALAACACLVIGGAVFFTNKSKNNQVKPGTEESQTASSTADNKEQDANPIHEVSSVKEMEEILGYSVPVLEKEVECYIVIDFDNNTKSARINYSDGTGFDMMKGSGDISGISGGTIDKQEIINGITVSFCHMEDINYAIWENDGFTYSLISDNLADDIATLIR